MNVSELIDKRIHELGSWRGETMARVRRLVQEAVPDIVEEWKWDTPVWSSNGNVLAVGAFQDHLKINFFHGALLEDRKHLFNAGLEAKTSRGIDIRQGDVLDEAALKELIRSAVALNNIKSTPARATPKPVDSKSKPAVKKAPAKKDKAASSKSDLPKLAAPAQRALAAAGISSLKQLSKWSEKEFGALHGIGPNAVKELKRALKASGLAFANK